MEFSMKRKEKEDMQGDSWVSVLGNQVDHVAKQQEPAQEEEQICV